MRDLGFVLYGGTAIALQLGHRLSIDFDFFCDREANKEQMFDVAPFLKHAVTLQDEAKTWTVQTGPRGEDRPVKLSFFPNCASAGWVSPLLGDDRDILIASLDDLLGHKLKVLLQRVDEKDYRDIAAMLDGAQIIGTGIGRVDIAFPKLSGSGGSQGAGLF